MDSLFPNSSIKVDNITYVGQEATEIFTQDLFNIDIVAQDAINVLVDVRGKRQLLSGKVKAWFEKYTCAWKNTTEASLAEKWIETTPIDLGGEFCTGQFYGSFLTESLRVSINHNQEVPPFTEWLFTQLRKEMSRAYQELFWRGDEDSNDVKLNAVDGIEKKLEESDDVEKIDGSALTTDNILAQVKAAVLKAIELAGAAQIDTADHKVYLNYNDLNYLKFALGDLCCEVRGDRVFSNYTLSNGQIAIYGMPVVPTMQTPSTIIVAPAKALTLATDIFDSHMTIKVVDMRETNLDDILRWRAISNLGTGILFDDLIVYSRVDE
jgi:hypothetical protein